MAIPSGKVVSCRAATDTDPLVEAVSCGIKSRSTPEPHLYTSGCRASSVRGVFHVSGGGSGPRGVRREPACPMAASAGGELCARRL